MSIAQHEELWSKIVGDFRRVCILRRQGRSEESVAVLEHEMPPSIAQWAQSCPFDPAAKRAQLQNMFRDEERRIEDAWAVQQFVSSHLNQELLPMLCSRLADEVRGAVYDHWSGAPSASVSAKTPGRTHAAENFAPRAILPPPVMPRFGLSPATAKRRFSFDNVSGLIDALAEQDRRGPAKPAAPSACRKPNFPKVDQDQAL